MNNEDIWHLVLYHFQTDFALTILLLAVVVSFLLSFAVGANDSANSWGTSVGSKTISLQWAYVLGSIMEIVGATMLSGDVIKKIAFGIVDMNYYISNKTAIIDNWTEDSSEKDYLMDERILLTGCLSVMLGSGIWQMIASWLSWPVAGTHCIIFGLLGFTVAAKGIESINEPTDLILTLTYMVLSILVTTVAVGLLYYPLYRWCIRSGKSVSRINKLVFSCISGLAVGIPVAFIIIQVEKAWLSPLTIFSTFSSGIAHLIVLSIGFGVGLVMAIISYFFFLPAVVNMEGDFALDCSMDPRNCLPRRRCRGSEQTVEMPDFKDFSPSNGHADAVQEDPAEDDEDDSEEIKRIFRPLQVISACNSALVHGANDVANCIGPFVLIWIVFQDGVLDINIAKADPIVALWGGIGIACGLTFYGKKVIMTMGSNISKMTSSRGFCVEWMTSLTVLVFTMFGIPLSTTHCKVGGLIGAGLSRGLVETGSPREALKYVNFHVLSGVMLSWVLTVPAAFGLSALIFLILKPVMI